jgi:hypothetical protein
MVPGLTIFRMVPVTIGIILGPTVVVYKGATMKCVLSDSLSRRDMALIMAIRPPFRNVVYYGQWKKIFSIDTFVFGQFINFGNCLCG